MPEPQSPSDIRASLIKYAAFCLSRRPYFQETLRQKLISRSIKLEFVDYHNVVEDILKDLKKSGYLDDEYLASAFVRRQLSKYYGPRVISLKLKRLQLDNEAISKALSEIDQESESASMAKYISKYPKLDKYKLRSKLFSRGYSTVAINNLFDSEYFDD